ncbi:MAG: PolC-type DNA polymerase III [Anaerorhabdus sp.]
MNNNKISFFIKNNEEMNEFYTEYKNPNKKVYYNKKAKSLSFSLLLNEPLPFDKYMEINRYFIDSINLKKCNIFIECKSVAQNINLNEIKSYLLYFTNTKELPTIFSDKKIDYINNELCFFIRDENDKEKYIKYNTNIIELFKNVGILIKDIVYTYEDSEHSVDSIVLPKNIKPSNFNTSKSMVSTDKKQYKYKKANYRMMKLSEIDVVMDNVQFIANVVKNEIRMTKSGNHMQILTVDDGLDALTIRRFENKAVNFDEMDKIKVGSRIQFFGSIIQGSYDQEIIGNPKEIAILENIEIKDNADKKRVELHVHSNISEMDGINPVEDYINQAFKWNHKAIAITDHCAVQAFPKAQKTVDKLLSAYPDRDFKMIYGVEMNLVDSKLSIVTNYQEKRIDDCEYVIFDVETTGLSAHFDHIIEFGAVKIKNQTQIDSKSFFLKSPIEIPTFIKSLTNITDEMIKDAPIFEDICDDLLSWIDGCVLVAHNAKFDIGFLNAELQRINRPKLKNTYIDTVDFARSIFSDRRFYRLGNIAKLCKVPYDNKVAHRADYDAEVLKDIFIIMLNDVRKKGVETLKDLQEYQSADSFIKLRDSHVCLLAKNQNGLKTIYDLVTHSNTKTLAVFKSKGDEFLADPRIFREELEKNRENILIGSSCLNGEVFEAAANNSTEDLAHKISFYDYIEIQPLENYAHLIELKRVLNLDRLKAILMRIIDEAKLQNKLIVATGDVHYCDPSSKIYRDIYINAQGIGGSRHPLKNKEGISSPHQHLRTTTEVLECFSWLNDEEFINEIVIDNTNKIADMIGKCNPVPKGLYPPKIDGADEKLRKICFDNAHMIYGDNLPDIVEDRLNKELNSIIGNGYGVIYYVSHLLVKKSNDDGYLVGSRGSVGSSFAATMSKITEVNPLQPHYICPNCQYVEFSNDKSISSGFDLVDKNCPNCNHKMYGEGQNIPFETFLGFEGDKVPDIDLNFSGDYQEKAHLFTKEVFGEDHVFRAGTIGTVQEKTAFGYVSGYCEEKGILNMRKARKDSLALGCTGIKRTTGQHPGGIIVIPKDMVVTDFTPVQYPANDSSSTWKTTHFDFHDIHDNVLKFDILGHVDPTAMKFLENVSGIDPTTIPMNDAKVMNLFSSNEVLKADSKLFTENTGALGIPEFGTNFVRKILESAKPKCFSDLIIISGLSHGTDVWLNNADDLIKDGIPLNEVIGCRDDIMTYLLNQNMDPKLSFTIMESVRKGKGLTSDWEQQMIKHNVPTWYIESCKKIKYMFPKAHAVAYVIMAVRIAWFKVYYPHWYYMAYFSLRCDAYEISTMTKGIDAIITRMNDINERKKDYLKKLTVTKKEDAIYNTLEVCLELYSRGYSIGNIDLYNSDATKFKVSSDFKKIIPPFITIDGLGENVANSIIAARDDKDFISKEDFLSRTQCSKTLEKKLSELGVLDELQERNQISLF